MICMLSVLHFTSITNPFHNQLCLVVAIATMVVAKTTVEFHFNRARRITRVGESSWYLHE